MHKNELSKVKPLKSLFDPFFGINSSLKSLYHTDQIFELIFRYRNSPEIADQILGVYNDLGYKSFDPFRMVHMSSLSRFHDASHIFLNAFVENASSFLDNTIKITFARELSKDEFARLLDRHSNRKAVKPMKLIKTKEIINRQDKEMDVDTANIVIIEGVGHMYRKIDVSELSGITIFIDEDRQFNRWCFLPGVMRRPPNMYAMYFSTNIKEKLIAYIDKKFSPLNEPKDENVIEAEILHKAIEDKAYNKEIKSSTQP